MKKITLLLIAISLYGQSQNMANIWRVRPDSICPGDTILVNYKMYSQPAQTNNFYFLGSPNNTIVGSFSSAYLLSMPKEHWSALQPGDSCYLVKMVVSINQAPGTYSMFTNPPTSPNFPNKVTVKNCSCTIFAGFTYTNTGNVYTFSSTTSGTNSTTQFLWDFSIGSGYNVYPSVVTFTFDNPGTYTIGLNVVNKWCSDIETQVITVNNTVGIKEYSQGELKPIYFDLFGNRTEPIQGVILIEQKGNLRKKVILQ